MDTIVERRGRSRAVVFAVAAAIAIATVVLAMQLRSVGTVVTKPTRMGPAVSAVDPHPSKKGFVRPNREQATRQPSVRQIEAGRGGCSRRRSCRA